jgi:hypothetical protein
MSKFMKVAVAVAAVVSLTATSAEAQSGNISATATVLQALGVSGAATLNFGTSVLPGINTTVDAATDATAGRFDLTGVINQGVNLSFVLPTNLNSGGNLLPIASWTGCLSPTATQAGCSAFTPSAGNTATALSGSGALSVYVGATVSPSGLQPAGSYSGTITLNASYY